MPDYPDIAAMARLSKVDYSYLESLDQVRPDNVRRADGSRGYPGSGTPEWWALRKRYEELLHKKVREQRASDTGTPVDEDRARTATWTALGNEAANEEYANAYRRVRPNNRYAVPLTAAEIAARNTMPLTSYGEIVNPFYLPRAERNRVDPQWAEWAARTSPDLYPTWFDDWLEYKRSGRIPPYIGRLSP